MTRRLIAPLVVLCSFLGAGGQAHGAYSEAREPSGEATGTVLLLHGGGWAATGKAVTTLLRPRAAHFRRSGYRTVLVDYRPGAVGLTDVLAAFDGERRRAPQRPICAYGESAGGHWALLLANHRRLACVIGAAAPTDLERLPPETKKLAETAFGASRLAQYSPASNGSVNGARVLLPTTFNDTVVPPPQAFSFAFSRPGALPLPLPPGNESYVHGTTSSTGLRQLDEAETALLTVSLSGRAVR